MILRKVTISGADDKSSISTMLGLSQIFPFVEWGVLLSETRRSTSRYPTASWVESICTLARNAAVQLCGHLCGQLARAVCKGHFPVQHDDVAFGRMQLNIAGCMDLIEDEGRVAACLPPGPEYILQVGGQHQHGIAMASRFAAAGVEVSVLFDASGGRGICPGVWPDSADDVSCGFAGGLGPENVQEQLACIEKTAKNRQVWVDLETNVRAASGELDFVKVATCLEISKKYARLAV